MSIVFHPHAESRMNERGCSIDEAVETIRSGERYPVKHGRIGFRRNFAFEDLWGGKHYACKQVEVIAVDQNGDWLVLTVIARYFQES